jgi:hypothetical protein
MNILEHEPIPLPGFEQRLWSELEELSREPAVGRARRPARLRGRGPGRGRGRGRYLAAVAGLAAAACVAVVALTVVDRGADGGRDRVGSPDDVPAQRVDDAVVVTESHDADGTLLSRRWSDEATGDYRLARYAQGKVTWEEQGRSLRFPKDAGPPDQYAGLTLGQSRLLVSHVARTWAEAPPFKPPTDGPAPVPPRQVDLTADAIARGDLVADGNETVGGVELLRYVSPATADEHTVVWLDPATRRPVRNTVDTRGTITSTFTYLPRTAANIAKAALVPPAGYRQVDDVDLVGAGNCNGETPGTHAYETCVAARDQIEELAGELKASVDAHRLQAAIDAAQAEVDRQAGDVDRQRLADALAEIQASIGGTTGAGLGDVEQLVAALAAIQAEVDRKAGEVDRQRLAEALATVQAEADREALAAAAAAGNS